MKRGWTAWSSDHPVLTYMLSSFRPNDSSHNLFHISIIIVCFIAIIVFAGIINIGNVAIVIVYDDDDDD